MRLQQKPSGVAIYAKVLWHLGCSRAALQLVSCALAVRSICACTALQSTPFAKGLAAAVLLQCTLLAGQHEFSRALQCIALAGVQVFMHSILLQ